MDLTNIAEQVTIMVVSGTVMWLGARLARSIWRMTDTLAAKLSAMYSSNQPISIKAKERLARMRELILVLCFVTMLGLQIRATGSPLQAWDVVMLSVWTWCLLTTLLHIARKR